MLPGYNTDIQHDGATYHIQTEDNGVSNPSIITLIYQGGAILARKKTDYSHLLNKKGLTEEVRRIMTDQHRRLIKMIQEGKLDEISSSRSAEPALKRSSQPQTLDEAIMQYLSEAELNHI